MRKIKCDVVVVGAGPGGSMAAKTCAKYGLDTVLVERKEYPSKPNSMGCLVSRRIAEYVHIDKKTTSAPIYGIVQTAPDGTEISMREPDGYEVAYVLNRDTFDNELLKITLKENIEYMNRTRATGLIREDGKIRGIEAKIDEKEDVEIRSNIVIGADGVEHKIGRWAGIYERLDPNDAWVVFDNLLDYSDIDEHTYYQIIGWRSDGKVMAYPNAAWVLYPKGEGKTALQPMPYHSLGWQKGEAKNALNYFMKNHPLFKKSKIIDVGGGVLPAVPLKRFTTDNVMLIGDAAHLNMMPWADGVMTAIESGVFAGERAVEACEEGDFSSEFLSEYEKRWNRTYGEKKMIGYYIAKLAQALPDKYWNIFCHRLKEDNAKFTDELFKVIKSPKLISKILFKLKKEGLEIPDLLSFGSLFKKYYRNYWDTFFE
ncbi:NAD(P)/FAD-dependent oxidoreductase [Candidatus Methanoliparum sp. LAM-1]|uniref:NAD(P)/FAD-dependent oxidoreductase n=1 Tax=Candidatus Methanoliparum sp. LAM-1 TaxID=2874846 RepID=UPI001E616F13|nr:NAD(P)/FAD-dependent oxidoreductase [Candidatus Methanoliparum sp. LAM-1]BDC35900.1 digeranylgeranylglycerophospholipid reductase [Candidatus Methanoliparum sp. LAM-1]